jgi:hypothetical protein
VLFYFVNFILRHGCFSDLDKEEMTLSTEDHYRFKEKGKNGELDDDFKSLFNKADNKHREVIPIH